MPWERRDQKSTTNVPNKRVPTGRHNHIAGKHPTETRRTLPVTRRLLLAKRQHVQAITVNRGGQFKLIRSNPLDAGVA